MPQADVDYDYRDAQKKKDTSRRSWIYKATTVFLAVSLGFGVHASKESLAPAEPTLERQVLGRSPRVPHDCADSNVVFTPLLWGALHGYNPAAVLICAPAGELSDALLLAGGLHLLLKAGRRPRTRAMVDLHADGWHLTLVCLPCWYSVGECRDGPGWPPQLHCPSRPSTMVLPSTAWGLA